MMGGDVATLPARRNPTLRVATWAARTAALGALLLLPISGLPEEADATAATMQVIFENVRELLELAASPEDFRADRNAGRVLAAARQVEDQASVLSEHMQPGGATEFLADTLERYAFLIGRSFELGDREDSRRLVFRVTDICIACHTRLRSANDSPLAADFVAGASLDSLSARERAMLQIATRQFDAAIASLEELLSDAELSEADFDKSLLAYLVVGLRVKGDIGRVLDTLNELNSRAQLDPARRSEISAWIDALLTARLEAPPDEVIDTAEAYLRNGERREAQSEGSGLVDFIIASGLLHRYLESDAVVALDRANASYLLGVAESWVSSGHWLPQVELYLETAIVLAPESETAKLAYDLLVEKMGKTYGDDWPDEVREHLDYLHTLITPG